MRDRLIELITEMENELYKAYPYTTDTFRIKCVADHLLANGVIVPPCNVGDTVWEIDSDNPFEEEFWVMESKAVGLYVGTSRNLHLIDCKTIFLTKEEAEQALKEREG